MKNVYIIAGPNGSGKTTFAREFLPGYAKCTNFVNADLIAQGLSPFSPRVAALKAGRLVIDQINDFSRRGIDFAFETTLSGRSYTHTFKALKEAGYHIRLFFLWIPTVELALARIKNRVVEGGHDVPAVDVKRRFKRGVRNLFTIYRPLVDSWMLFDNSGVRLSLIAEESNKTLRVSDTHLLNIIIKENEVHI